MGCDFTDRIEVGLVTESAELTQAIEKFRDYIAQETLSVAVRLEPLEGVQPVKVKIGEHELEVYIRIVSDD